jgi:3-oxoacyl-[acyl-carrier protein] reductase
MEKLEGKIALAAGASKGIGVGVALAMAKEGAAVAVNYSSDEARWLSGEIISGNGGLR